jgi:hypothetical protein
MWSGNLAPHGRLVLSSSGLLEGGGSLSISGGQGLPTVDIKIDSISPTLKVDVLPPYSPQRVVITNPGDAAVMRINFNWSLK